jgi:hypothetical protein
LAAAATPRLSDSQRAELIGLVDESDSVELKLTVPAEGQRSAVDALGMDPLGAQIRQVFFFDTPDLALYEAGVVARARRVQKKGDDSVVKLRPVVPSDLSTEVRSSPNMVVEVDAMPGGFVCSASLKRTLGTKPVREAHLGERKVSKLFSKEQRAFFAEHAPSAMDLDELTILGPIPVFKLKFAPKGYDRRMVAELWMYPDNTRILELSTKCAPSEAFDVAARARAFLIDRGVDLDGEQQTKTRTALDFFAREARASRRKPAKPRAKRSQSTSTRKPAQPKPASEDQSG